MSDGIASVGLGRPGLVRLAGNTLRLAALRDSPDVYGPLFVRARAEVRHGECLCLAEPLRLVIRCTSAGRFHLAGWPGEGQLHEAACPFNKSDLTLSGRSGYSTAAISEDESGTSIRLASPLLQRLTPTGQIPRFPADGGASTAAVRRKVGLLGLLHWLWEEAGLTAWRPGRPSSWSHTVDQLRQQLINCHVGDRDLASVLHVVPPFSQDTATRNAVALELFTMKLGPHGDHIVRGLLLGELKTAPIPTQHGVRFQLAHQRENVFASNELMDRLKGSYRHVFSDAAGKDARRIGLFLVTRGRKGALRADDAAVMLTTRQYIPADSSYEVMMGHHLVGAGRSFTKPVLYEGGEAVFPDFILTDTAPHTYLEVYGVRGRESYEQRKREKQAHYAAEGIPVVEWDGTGALPTLPAIR